MFSIITFILLINPLFNGQPTSFVVPASDQIQFSSIRRPNLYRSLITLTQKPTEKNVGWAHDDNFVIMTPDQPSAEKFLKEANKIRNELQGKLGTDVPSGVGRCSISIKFSKTEDRGQTWLKDNPARKFHLMWIACPEEKVEHGIRHEITHVLLQEQFGGIEPIPSWMQEGAASREDDKERVELRRKTLRWLVDMRSGKRFNSDTLENLIEEKVIEDSDHAGYSLGWALVDYFFTKGDGKVTPADYEKLFVDLLQIVKEKGWEYALKDQYGINGFDDLEAKLRKHIQEKMLGKEPPKKN